MLNMKTDAFVTEWVINTVKEKYADDIALVVAHSTLNIDTETPAMSYFVPITDRGRQFAQTFILEGRGYDIWGIEWERLEGFAALDEYNITVLADSEILYARTSEDAERFNALKNKQLENLRNPAVSRRKSLEAYATAKLLYTELLFADGSKVRLCEGYVLDYLARAIAFANNSYFRRSQVEQTEELKSMANVPEGFADMYLEVIRTSDDCRRKELCHKLVAMVGKFLAKEETAQPERNFQDLADWYAELAYTWQRIRTYAARNDAVKVYMWGIVLQNELDEVCGDFGLEKTELMNEFDFDDLSRIVARADALEKQMRSIITEHGGKIREYKTNEEFLHEI